MRPTCMQANESTTMLTRSIPSSGEKLPVIGLGTWQTFDVGQSETARAPLEEVLRVFARFRGSVIDSSPMYGQAEQVVGDLIAKLRLRDQVFLATKVWTRGRQAGIESMERSFARLQTKRIDLMQVHNLLAGSSTCRRLRDEGGRPVALRRHHHLRRRRHAEIEQADAQRRPSTSCRSATTCSTARRKQRILPLAQERGIGRHRQPSVPRRRAAAPVARHPLPGWAAEIDCHFLGAGGTEVRHGPSGGDLRHPGDEQPAPP